MTHYPDCDIKIVKVVNDVETTICDGTLNIKDLVSIVRKKTKPHTIDFTHVSFEHIDEDILKLKDTTHTNLLSWYCKNKKPEFVIELIDTFDEKCISEQVNCEGNTALIYACMNNMEDVAIKLIDTFGEKCIPEQVNRKGHTALSLTCALYSTSVSSLIHKNGMPTVVNKLLNFFEHNESIANTAFIPSYTLVNAIENRMEDVAIKLINVFPSKCKIMDVFQDSALLLACKYKMNRLANIIIDVYEDSLLEYEDITVLQCSIEREMTALRHACENKMEDVAIKLMDKFGWHCIPPYNCHVRQETNTETSLWFACLNNMSATAIKFLDTYGYGYFCDNRENTKSYGINEVQWFIRFGNIQ